MQNALSSWKTTLAGVLAIAAVVVHQFAPQYAAQLQSITAILLGLGLIHAEDSGKSNAA